MFVVEGPRLVERALAAGLEPLEVYHDPDRVNASGLAAVSVAPEALDKASYRSRSEGLIAVFEQIPLEIDSLSFSSDGLYLMAEGLEKPGNLGAMLRTADAVGADGFIVIDSVVDVYNPNCLRSSTGAVFTVPLAVCSLTEAVAWLQGNEIRLVAASPGARAELWGTDLTGAVAILVGSEALGLSDEARSIADSLVKIPMAGPVDSLNSSVSLAVLAYEASRQRHS